MGRTAFQRWSGNIIEMAGVPDNASTRFCVAGMVLHGSGEGKNGLYTDISFVRRLRKFAANDVAMSITTELKTQREAALKEENNPTDVVPSEKSS
jgi:hypothetical protein